ncbi:MAG: PadR family transcriptional regulator [Candidatus Hodarchaeota archaeon]
MSDDLLLQRWQTEYKKGFSKPLILFTLAEVGRSYAYLLTKKILELTDGEISIAGSNIYPMLTKLEEDNLLVSQLDESDRKFYQLTNSGKEFLRQLETSIKEFNKIMIRIIDNNQNKEGE